MIKLIAAAALIVLGLVFKLAFIGYGMIAYTCFGLALFLLCLAVLDCLSKAHETAARRIRRVLYGAAAFAAAILTITIVCISTGAKSEGDSDVVIVLGTGVNGTVPSGALSARLRTALEYSEENPDALFILSGGQGDGEDISEARCMYDWLTERGVDEDRLYMEDKSTRTVENIEYSKELMEREEIPQDGGVMIISEGYHLFRARLIAKENGFEDISTRAADTGLVIFNIGCYIREALALWNHIVFA